MKFKTVREGQQALILNYRGEGHVVIGPQRVFLFRERFQRLPSVIANRNEYVEIKECTGKINHVPGPCEVYNNPLEFERCVVRQAVRIDANHLLVVYKRVEKEATERRIIQGPAVFIPGSEEWVHEFKWHGADPKENGRMVPDKLCFQQLATIPSNFYYNVREVRTNDDSMITVKLMVFYEMLDVLTMLDTTHDPIGDLINAVCADVISLVGPLTYEDFISKTCFLSDLTSYTQLQQRAQRIGFKVQKVVYIGYHASDQMQQMQNRAIESRTHLRLQREIEDQEQKLVNFRLNKQQERSKIEQDMEVKKQTHVQKLSSLKQDHSLGMQEQTLQQQLELSTLESQVTLETKEATDKHKEDHLASLGDIGVDLNAFLALESSTRPQEEIRIISS